MSLASYLSAYSVGRRISGAPLALKQLLRLRDQRRIVEARGYA
jgi:hypothetical protein